jgi:hypothetical protein
LADSCAVKLVEYCVLKSEGYFDFILAEHYFLKLAEQWTVNFEKGYVVKFFENFALILA